MNLYKIYVKAITITFALFYFGVSEINAQCCTAGNPVSSSFNISGNQANRLGVSVSNIFSYSDTYYTGSKYISGYKYIKDSYFNFIDLSVNYQLTDLLNLRFGIGYYTLKKQNFEFTDGFTYQRNAYGVADAQIGASYNLFESKKNNFQIIPTLAVTLPVGVFDQMYDNVVLPIDLQPSSGAFKYEAGLNFQKTFSKLGLTLISINNFEYSQKISTERTSYKYGNLYNFSILAFYKLMDKVPAMLKFRAQYREKATDDANKLIESTGGLTIFVMPQVDYQINDKFRVHIGAELPIFRNLNGIQFSNSYMLRLGLSSNYDLTNDKKFAKIVVSGSCEQCKARIESVILNFPEVESVSWNKRTQIATIKISRKIDIIAVALALAEAGHDNEFYKAPDEEYNKLPECCHYRN